MFLCVYVAVIDPYFLNFICKWPMAKQKLTLKLVIKAYV